MELPGHGRGKGSAENVPSSRTSTMAYVGSAPVSRSARIRSDRALAEMRFRVAMLAILEAVEGVAVLKPRSIEM